MSYCTAVSATSLSHDKDFKSPVVCIYQPVITERYFQNYIKKKSGLSRYQIPLSIQSSKYICIWERKYLSWRNWVGINCLDRLKVCSFNAEEPIMRISCVCTHCTWTSALLATLTLLSHLFIPISQYCQKVFSVWKIGSSLRHKGNKAANTHLSVTTLTILWYLAMSLIIACFAQFVFIPAEVVWCLG